MCNVPRVHRGSLESDPLPGRGGSVTLALMLIMGAIGPFGGNMILPMISVLKNELSTDVSMIMLSLTLFMVPFAIIQFFSGGISDVYGRRKPIVGGMAIYALGSALASGAVNIWGFIAARVVQGVGYALVSPVIIAVIGDLTDVANRGRYMGFLSSAIRTGIAVGPFVGGAMAYQWRMLFLALAAASAGLAACSWVCLRGLKAGGEGALGEVMAELKEAARYREVLAVSAAGFIAFFSYIALMSLSSDALTSFPYFLDPNSVGLILSISGVLGIVSSSVAGFLTDRLGKRIVPAVGVATAVLALVALTFVTKYSTPIFPFYLIPNVAENWQTLPLDWQTLTILFTLQGMLRALSGDVFMGFLVFMSMMGVGISFIWPALLALSVEVVPPRMRGTSASIFSGTRFLGYALAPIAFTPVYLQTGLDATFLLSAALLSLVAWIIHVTTRRRTKGEEIKRE